jgi:hypothetical protein
MSITSTQLQQQYIAYFGRPGDPEGINYWTSDATDIKTAADFADKIYAQSEYQTTTLASKSTSEQVNQLYVNLFNRSADASGLLYWTTEIEKGSLSLSNLAYDLIYATQNPLEDNGAQAAQDAANLNAKVAAAEAYTNTVASNASALMAYQPGAAYDSAVSFISSVSFNAQVNQPVITTAAGLAPLNTQAVNTFVGQMLSAQASADAQTAAADAQAAQADAQAAAQATQLQLAQLQAAQAEAAAAQATLANQQAITAAAAEAEAAAEAAANAPQTLILATTLDNLTGGSQDDLFNGAAGTLDSDILNGGDGNDTLKVTLDNATDANATFQSTSIENLKFRTAGAAGVTVDLGDVTDVTSITGERLTRDLTLEDVQSIPTSVNIERVSSANNPTLELNFNGTVVTGAEDTTTVNISNSSSTTTVNVDEVETVNLVSTDDPAGTTRNVVVIDNASTAVATETLNISGTGDLTVTATDALTVNNSASSTVTLNPTLATTITHTGSGSLTVSAGAAAQTVTASGTGALTYTAGTGVSSVTGSTGDDRFVFAGNLLPGIAGVGDTVVGGDGTDTLSILGDTGVTTAFTLISGIETLEVNTETTGDTIDLSLFTDAISTVNTVLGDTNSNNNDTVVTLNESQATTYGVSTPTTGAAAITLAGLTIAMADATSTSDAITVNLNNTQVNLANALTVTDITANDIETITINADSASTTTTAVSDDITLTTLAADDLTSLTITGDADFTITNALGAATNPVDTVNASAATDAVTLTFSGSDIAYTGGSGVDTLSFGTSLTSADSIDGGDGTDVVNAEFNAGTVTPAAMTSIETFNATFSGGALNASNLGSLTTLNLDSATASAVISGVPATTTTIQQSATTGNPSVNIQYVTGADATVAWTNGELDAAAIANGATTFGNVSTLTVSSDNGVANDSTVDLGSLNGSAGLTSLTLNTSSDSGDTLDTGNISGINLETINISVDEANFTMGGGAFASANELKTLSISNVDKDSSGTITVGTIGNVSAADELTSINITTQGNNGGGSVVSVGAITATRAATGAEITDYTINLAGVYNTSSVGALSGSADISAVNITTAATAGDSLEVGAITPTNGSILGDVTINAGNDFTGTSAAAGWIQTEANGSVGNISLTSGGTMQISATGAHELVGAATTVGNLSFNTLAAADSIDVGEVEQATTIGNIDVVGLGSVTFDGAPAATTIGNINVAVGTGETVTLDGNTGSIGTTGGVMGSTTVTGTGAFNMTIGAVTALGNIDLSGLTGSGSSSNISLNNSTEVGVIYTGSEGNDIFTGTGGADVITLGLGFDSVTTSTGGDTITLTETSNSTDTVFVTPAGVTLGTSNSLDTITGFLPGANNDVIGIPITAWTNANAVLEEEDGSSTLHSETPELIPFAAENTTVAQGADDGNILYVTDTGIDAWSDIAITMTLDNNVTAAAGDGMPILWHNEDGWAEFGLLLNEDSDNDLQGASAQYTPLLRLNMTKTVYDTFDAGNFDFVNA